MSTVDLLANGLGLAAAERAALIAAATSKSAVMPRQPDEGVRLPVPPTAWLGREHDVAAEVDLLGKVGVRLVTLTGPGGIGKTRLALAVAADRRDAYADGVAFVDVAPLRDCRLVPSTMARALGLQETSAANSEQQLVAHLRKRQVLLLVDNCEHVLEGTGFLAELLATCHEVAVLATSRAALRLRGERLYSVPSLSVPSADSADPRKLAQSAAVALFVERAQEVSRNFALTQANGQAIAGICRRLDGLPLAIELAARWPHVLPPQVLLDELGDRLQLSVRGGAGHASGHARPATDAARHA